MLYIERKPGPLLAPFVRVLWLTSNPAAAIGRQRILPTGHMQILFNLGGDSLTDLSRCRPTRCAPALLNGAYSASQVIATEDLTDLAGAVLRPGGFVPLFGGDANEWCGTEVDLRAILGSESEHLRDQLASTPTTHGRLDVLEAALNRRLLARGTPVRCALTRHMLHGLSNGKVIAEIVRSSGRSARTMGERFRNEVGLGPKLYARVRRFQQTVQAIHRGKEVDWARLGLNYGFYYQAHLTHEFRAFAGMTPSAYETAHRPWSNHLELPDDFLQDSQ